ncbi:MAG TPA: cytochrome c-type biogenesis protein [Marinobacter sp.]|nr:cytochrome c-type biogenesis protein [Marinobacter sp.]
MFRLFSLLVFFAIAGFVSADVANVYDFDTVQQEQRFQKLAEELRCPKCQNQNISDSDAPIAKDMRDEVYRMMLDGASNEDIVNALVARFGEFVRYKPELEKRTLLLWATPIIAVFGGLLIVAGVVIRSRRSDGRAPTLTADQKARAEKLLAESE